MQGGWVQTIRESKQETRGYQVYTLYDITNPADMQHNVARQRDTVFWKSYDANQIRYLVFTTNNIQLPALRQSGYEAKFTRLLQQELRRTYSYYKKFQRRYPRNELSFYSNQDFAWAYVLKVDLLVTPRHDSLVSVVLSQAEGGPERKSFEESYCFRFKSGHISYVRVDVLKERIWAAHSRWLATRMDQYITDLPPPVCNPKHLQIANLSFTKAGLRLDCFCSHGEGKFETSGNPTLSYSRALMDIFLHSGSKR